MGRASEETIDWCLGDAAPTTEPGIHLGDVLYYDRELRAG